MNDPIDSCWPEVSEEPLSLEKAQDAIVAGIVEERAAIEAAQSRAGFQGQLLTPRQRAVLRGLHLQGELANQDPQWLHDLIQVAGREILRRPERPVLMGRRQPYFGGFVDPAVESPMQRLQRQARDGYPRPGLDSARPERTRRG